MLFQIFLVGAILGCFYALLGLGFTVIYGTVRLINFAHGGVYMVGAFVGFSLLGALAPTGNVPLQVVGSLAGTVAATALMGYIIRWVLAHLKAKAGSLGPMIAAVGIGIVIENGALHLWGSAPRVYPVQFGQGVSRLVVTLSACLLLLVGTELWIGRTKFGIAMRAAGIDHGAVRLMGISVEKVVIITFMVFSAIAGITGYLAGIYYGVIQFQMGFELGLKGFTAAVLGGVGNVRGALVGGIVLGLVEAFGGAWLGTEWTSVIAFSVLIAVLTLRPTGILGETIVERM